MEISIDEQKYEVALGFGNVMSIQGMLTAAFGGEEFSELELNEDLTLDDLEDKNNADALAASAKLMPLVLEKVLRKVNGQDITTEYINDSLPLAHGMELFNKVMEHIGELNAPKVSAN